MTLFRQSLDASKLQRGFACGSRHVELQQQQPARRRAKRARKCSSRKAPGLQIHCVLRADYAATACDSSVLRRPLKEELQPADVRNVFDFPRNLQEKYELGKILGAGSFGIVREAVGRRTGTHFACKTIPKIPKRGKGTPRYLLKLQTEVDAMVQLGPSLDAVYLKGVFEDDENIHLVMELCSGGGILDRMKDGTLTEARVADIMRSVLRFIAQCHAKGIIYRDVKPDNFLFLTPEEKSPIRATDFGLSIRHRAEEGKLKSRSGTPVYMAPEVIMQEYGPPADLWSVGMLMYQLLTGTFPFWDSVQNISLQQVWQAVLTKRVELESRKLKSTISDSARDLLKGLLVRDQDKRMTAAQALQHPWVCEAGCAPDVPLEGTVMQRLQRHATYGHMKQLVLHIIAQGVIGDKASKELEMVTALRELFEALDTDRSGGLDANELADGLLSRGYRVTKAEMDQLIDRMDLNQDGNIAFDEFSSALVDWQKLQSEKGWERWVDDAFSKLDINGDGFISMEEILDKLPLETTDPDDDMESERFLQARRMLREADDNGDGLISREEFHDLFTRSTTPDVLQGYDARWTAPEASNGAVAA
ncbi:g5351 [Coccomyxa viridis]|uniref:G5351 protein n=1 Tax=Coccomyxa viridis TaxID=1274662 RepID=A0ABP1FSL8_9CHLO